MDHKDAKMPLDSFLEQFREIYSDDLDVQQLQSDLKDLIVIQENSIGNATYFYTLNSTDYFSFLQNWFPSNCAVYVFKLY